MVFEDTWKEGQWYGAVKYSQDIPKGFRTKTQFTRYGEIYTPSTYLGSSYESVISSGGAASSRWYGSVEYSDDIPWGLGPDATYFNTPGAVENYLDWIGGDRSGIRGEAVSRERPASIQITGEAEVLRNLGVIIRRAHNRALKRLGQNCEFILSESKKEVPWDTTHLQQTGTVEPVPEIDGFEIGYNTPYAARQHEDMTLHHPKPGTKAKYLEDPAMRIAPTIAEDIAEHLKGVLG